MAVYLGQCGLYRADVHQRRSFFELSSDVFLSLLFSFSCVYKYTASLSAFFLGALPKYIIYLSSLIPFLVLSYISLIFSVTIAFTVAFLRVFMCMCIPVGVRG